MQTAPRSPHHRPMGPFSCVVLPILGVTTERLRPLVENGHLRVRVPSDSLSSTIVARPGQRALEWLRTMFQPLEMRPVIPLKEVGKLWRTTEREIIATCKHYRIPIYSEPVFGYLMSFDSLKRYGRARRKYHKPKPLDRAGFLRFYRSEICHEPWKSPPRYSERLEMEINRIARLPQPHRTFRSMALIEAFQDARTVTECIRNERHISEEVSKCERSIEELRAKVLTQEWRSKARREAEMQSLEEVGVRCSGLARISF